MKRSLIALLTLACSAAGIAAQDQDQDQVDRRYRSLIETEPRFAAASVELGSAAAFRTYLAREAVIFRPGPVNGWEVVAQQPDDGATLEWAPAQAELSQAGDLGLTVGAWRRTVPDGARTYGRYVTLWQRTIEGSWRVTADIGTSTTNSVAWPSAVAAGALTPRSAGRDLSERALDERLEALRTADCALAAEDSATAHEARTDPSALAYRNGRDPIGGRQAVASLASSEAVSRELVDAVVARSGDLGYTYGAARHADGSASGYLRVWLHAPGDGWRVLIDVVTAG